MTARLDSARWLADIMNREAGQSQEDFSRSGGTVEGLFAILRLFPWHRKVGRVCAWNVTRSTWHRSKPISITTFSADQVIAANENPVGRCLGAPSRSRWTVKSDVTW
jgi:hypothetical protein